MKRGICLIALAGLAIAADTASWPAAERVAAVGDVHGDYGQFLKVLQSAGLIDAKRNWSGGNTHLVQLGDVPDRGPDTRKVMDLLIRLESQARRAGGRVHALIGNHEAMNVYGDLRYVTPEEYGAFRSGRSQELLEEWFRRLLEQKSVREEDRAEFFAGHPPGFVEHRLAFGPEGKYGKWIRDHNAAVRIGETLFLHGGISPKYVDVPLEDLNARVRNELDLPLPPEDGILRDEAGPLWYRGLAQDGGEAMERHVGAVLRAFGVKRIVIGHTPTSAAVLPRFSGSVILADVGLSGAYGGPPACLLIEGGVPYALHRGARIRIPGEDGEPVREYLRQVAAQDPSPSPVRKLIETLAVPAEAAPF